MRWNNGFWRMCEALDSDVRIGLLRYLMAVDETEFPCVCELARRFKVSEPAMSVHLKKLAVAGLAASKCAGRRVCYRAVATTPSADRVLAVLRTFFANRPTGRRLQRLGSYVRALSHCRRNAIVRCLHREPGLDAMSLARRVGMPRQTVDRLLAELNKARVVNADCRVVLPAEEPEAMLLDLTLAPSLRI